jgi:crotonobetainyl-CoA:carnitine CoA-transferase CaiB-like acyl-CoA transferase
MDTGLGQYIDVSMHESGGHIGGYAIPTYSADGTKPFRTSRAAVVKDLYDAYEVKDGLVRLFIIPRDQWRRLVEWMGSPPLVSDPLFEDMEFRRQNTDLIHDTIAEFCKQFTKEEMYDEAQRRRIAVTPVYTAREFVESAQTKARNIFLPMEHPEVGPYQHFGPVPRFSETPGRIARTAPLLGEHNEEVYCGDLGFARRDLVALAAAGVI